VRPLSSNSFTPRAVLKRIAPVLLVIRTLREEVVRVMVSLADCISHGTAGHTVFTITLSGWRGSESAAAKTTCTMESLQT